MANVKSRLFIALWPPGPVRKHLVDLQKPLASVGKLVPGERLHLTLAFLGDVEKTKVDDWIAALRTINAPQFTMTLDRWGRFARSRTIWVGPDTPPSPLFYLRSSIEALLIDACHPVEHSFTPHITMVRKAGTISLSSPLSIEWPVESFALVQSTLSNDGPVYDTLARFQLTG